MNASWSMVLGALLAGLVGGFMIPVRPEIRDVPALTASKTTEPAKTAAEPVAAKADGDCAREAWPYRSPNCLDRAAAVAPAEARRVESNAGVAEKTSETATAAPPKPEPAKPEAAKPEPAKPEPKVVTAPVREEQAEPAPPAGQAAARSEDEPRAQAVDERPEAKPAKQTRRAARRANRNTVDFNDGIPTRIYLRGPDGRLYLAPEYQPSGRPIFFVR